MLGPQIQPQRILCCWQSCLVHHQVLHQGVMGVMQSVILENIATRLKSSTVSCAFQTWWLVVHWLDTLSLHSRQRSLELLSGLPSV